MSYPTRVLQFSGGKDSLLCLHLLREDWPDITVAWINTGAAFPETIEQMELTRELVPHFLEFNSHQSIEQRGYPADVLPVKSTAIGQVCEGPRPHRFQSRYDCCKAALWDPMQVAMKALGATCIIRGQKACDARRSPIKHGDVIEGVRYEFPLEEWSDADVVAELIALGALPDNYVHLPSGLDCWNCTAYLEENRAKPAYLKRFHPEKLDVLRPVYAELLAMTDQDLNPLRELNL